MAYTTINKPADYFNTLLYTGTGATHNVTGVGFQPDWLWIKDRDSTSGHYSFDVVRGAGKALNQNATNAESTNTNNQSSFDSDGFTVGTGGGTNASGNDFVSWNWLAGGSASSNTDGTITSSVSANTTSGFSIVSYTGSGANASIGHGLGVAPAMYIVKNRDAAQEWSVYHHKNTSAPETEYLDLNDTGATTDFNLWQDTAPTSSVFTVVNHARVNSSGNDYIAYCFAEKKGFSKFGSYTGNGNADGTFVYTGFKPAMVIVKVTSTTNNWNIFDNKRSPINDIDKRLFPNLGNAEQTGTASIDFLSNGFKCRNTNDNYNLSGGTFIYMAFAENPLVTSGGTPATAR